MSISAVLTTPFDRASLTPPLKPISLAGSSVVEGVQARVMGKMDVDGDGGLTAAELSAGVSGGRAPGAVDPAYFAAVDKDSDGKLQLGELQASAMFGMNTLNALLAAQEASPSAEPSARFDASNISAWMVREADQDGDGALTAEEFAAVGPAGDWKPRTDGLTVPGADILSKTGRAFFEADTDQDGKLTAGELEHLMESGPQRLYFTADTARLAPVLMREADADGDAALSVEEARSIARTPEGLSELFVQGDTDGDAKLSAAEMDSMIDARSTLYSTGVFTLDDIPTAGELALRRLLLASIDRMGEAFKSRLERQSTEMSA